MATRRIRKIKYTKKKRTRGGVKRSRSNSQNSPQTKRRREDSISISSLSSFNSKDSLASAMELDDMNREDFVYLTPMKDTTYNGIRLIKNRGIILEGEPVTLSYTTGWGDPTIANGIREGKYEARDMRFLSKDGARFSKGTLVAQGEPLENGYRRAFVEEYNTHRKAPIRPEHMEFIYYNERNISKKKRKLHEKLEK
jgi:hypothetical protein